ncbi:hypothetical protein JHK85_010369 [Glycine max]|nr:hypothetical protein JHK85_010369 [Glycine max]
MVIDATVWKEVVGLDMGGVRKFDETPYGSQGDEHAVINHQNKHSVSVNIPFSCEEVQLDNTIRVLYSGENDFSSQSTTIDSKPPLPSQSMSNGSVHPEATNTINFTNHESIKNLNDKRIGFLKTWSSKLW